MAKTAADTRLCGSVLPVNLIARSHAGVFALVLVGCGPSAQVNSFNVQPPVACPGVPVRVDWDVRGAASLRAQRGPNDWDEGVVPSKGERTVSPASSTTFTVTALDADRAKGAWTGSKTVQVPTGTSAPRSVSAPCDAASRKCTGSFVIDAVGGDVARGLSAPTVTWKGADKPAAICVTHARLAGETCIPGGGSVAIPAPGIAAAGTWTLAFDLPPGEEVDPPRKLQIHVDFGCL